MASWRDQNARDCLRRGIAEAVDKGDLRPHEAERALDLAVTNWEGRVTAGDAVRTAVNAFKTGAAR